MQVGELRIAEDTDFALLKLLLTRAEGWQLEYQRGHTKVWTRPAENSSFRMIRLQTEYSDVRPDCLYDVLQDQEFRPTWDKHMLASSELGCLNPNNDVSYYALHCPPPLKNRDFVLQRSWLQTEQESYIINHSVFHRDYPVQKGFVRGLSHLTGFLVSSLGPGCSLGYVAHSDPGGRLPAWVTNKLSSVLAPGLVKRLHTACHQYPAWKARHRPHYKPWLYPEQQCGARLSAADCVQCDTASPGDCSPLEDESGLSEVELAAEFHSLELS